MDVESISRFFKLDGENVTVSPFGRGHINTTYRVKTDEQEYVLQKINHQVFKRVDQLMDNIVRVTQYLNGQIDETEYETIQLIPTHNGNFFHQCQDGNYWRMYIFKSHLHAFEFPKNLNQVYESARAFGRFLAYLKDFPVDQIQITIPNFHNVKFRLTQLHQALNLDIAGRKSGIARWTDYAFYLSDQMMTIERLGEKGRIPIRVIHNDCKFNNALLDERDHGRCIIDLDTIMPGYVHYDFGDGIRTTTSTAKEDEADLSLIEIDRSRFASFTAGYLDATRTLLNPVEVKYLGISGALLSYLMGVRFLTDYLNGDQYYKVAFDDHNLVRARAQLTLTQVHLAQLDELNDVVKRLS